MRVTLPDIQALHSLTLDGRVLMLTRVARLFAYGFLSVVFALLLAKLGLSDQQIGLVLTQTLIGDATTLMRTRPTLRETPGLGSLAVSSARGCDAASGAPYGQGLTGVDWYHMEGINHGASTADRH